MSKTRQISNKLNAEPAANPAGGIKMRHFESGVGENLGKTWTCYDCGRTWSIEEAITAHGDDPVQFFICRGEEGKPHRGVYLSNSSISTADLAG